MDTIFRLLDNKIIRAEEFLKHRVKKLKLPKLLVSEEQLRNQWADPETRRGLLNKLKDAGCHKEDLERMQEFINPKDCDLLDVLEYIAYAKPPISRAARMET